MNQKKFNILLLIHNQLDRQLLENYLSELGYTIHKSILQDPLSETNMVITDLKNAKQFYNKILALKHQSSPLYFPIIILLPQTSKGTGWLQLGFDQVIRLPIIKAELEASLNILHNLENISKLKSHIIFEEIPIGIYRMTNEGRIISTNPALVKILGYQDANDIMHKTFDEIGIETGENRQDLYKKVRLKKSVLGHSSIWLRHDGTTIHVRENIIFFEEKESKLFYYVGTLENITVERQLRVQQSKLKSELQQVVSASTKISEANIVKSTFLAEMSHELRTPLNSIMGFSQLLYEEKVGQITAQQKKFLSNVLISAQELLELIDNILDISKIESKKMEFHPRATKLDTFLIQTIETFRLILEKKHINLNYKIDPSLESIIIDSSKFSQILKNYISNAIKFTPEFGNIGVKIYPYKNKKDFFCLEVSDTGIGVKEQDLEKLFLDFSQLNQDISKVTQGTGLGLALTKRLVEAQGGYVKAESVYGKGSKFYAILPLVLSKEDMMS